MACAGPSPRAQPRAEKAGFLFLVGADAWRERTDCTLTGLNQVSTSSVVEGKELPPRSASESARVSSPDDGGDDAPGVLAVHYVLEESSGYMEPTLRILAVLHTVISFFCIIGYYCLKVSRAALGPPSGKRVLGWKCHARSLFGMFQKSTPADGGREQGPPRGTWTGQTHGAGTASLCNAGFGRLSWLGPGAWPLDSTLTRHGCRLPWGGGRTGVV